MYDGLSNEQHQRFRALSGEDYETHSSDYVDDGGLRTGKFLTKHPYDNKDWKLSPWHFSFVLEKDTGYLVCELEHRMTNNRIHGWDRRGVELPDEILHRHFQPHF
ncbi:MAG: hypothetical protein OXI79_06365 [Gammaproteobacteria bacterium]|nr:hypothetical protein [Gammaproteobacteria bacterium]